MISGASSMAVHQGVGMAALTALVSNKRHHHHRLAQAKQINTRKGKQWQVHMYASKGFRFKGSGFKVSG